MISAAPVTKKAYDLSLKVKRWVKTSLAPGSRVVEKYLDQSGVREDLNKQGFLIVGYGCTTCIRNGDLDKLVAAAIEETGNNILMYMYILLIFINMDMTPLLLVLSASFVSQMSKKCL
ncbi:unnamed protein product [Eruca vesicaria subsp. sativa]|uniref:Aconitase/3-isopropylmalate dehydratase large subunit alpha/beta/alpha domain-containing protein n=1 Tax=Eruca vesicaria subsp. sativa TaxID=29727 RepID=A0ABC8KBR5_ERUVS|nr:unnamed protein product [Eruca vesicaria subsp. sativa]